MKKLRKLAVLVSIAAVAFVSFFMVYKIRNQTQMEKEVHYHAGFQVYVDNVQQDFSNFKYMDFIPCSTNPDKLPKEDPQIEKAHLHDGVGDVVHVEHEGAKWSDLFKNIGYTFDHSKQIVGYANDQKVDDILATSIQPNESVVIIFGSQDNVQTDLKNKVSQEKITTTENKSELCGKK